MFIISLLSFFKCLLLLDHHLLLLQSATCTKEGKGHLNSLRISHFIAKYPFLLNSILMMCVMITPWVLNYALALTEGKKKLYENCRIFKLKFLPSSFYLFTHSTLRLNLKGKRRGEWADAYTVFCRFFLLLSPHEYFIKKEQKKVN